MFEFYDFQQICCKLAKTFLRICNLSSALQLKQYTLSNPELLFLQKAE